MPITDYKVAESDYLGHDVESLSNRPSADGVDAALLKHRFDAVGKEVIAPKLNGLIDALSGTTAGSSGAENVGSEAISGVDGSNVHDQMANLKGQLDGQVTNLAGQINSVNANLSAQMSGITLGQMPDNTITDIKLSNTSTEIKARVANITDMLSNFSTVKLNMDVNGIYTEVHHKRADNTLIFRSALSGGLTPKYTTRTETKFAADGSTVEWSRTYAITYDANGNVASEVLQ